MSKNTNLSFLTDYITADITNGRIGINNASPAYAFDVTGIARTSTSTYLATASGNVGIGTTTPATQLSILSLTPSSSTLDAIFNITNDVDSNFRIFVTGSAASDKRTAIGATTNTALAFITNNTERMRILANGNVLIANTIYSADRLSVEGTANNWTGKFVGSTTSTQSFGIDIVAGTSSADYPLYVRTTNFTLRLSVRGDGYCYIGASSWAYGSDLRMKENISDVINGLDLVSKLKPKHFDYINGAKNNLGFIAQEVQELIPQAVSISDEKTGMLALKTDFIIPYLVKAIQELSAEITILKNK